MQMINKYWENRKKIEWLNENFESVSDRNWGRNWFYHPGGQGPPYRIRVAHLDNETQSCRELNIDYQKIKKYFKKEEKNEKTYQKIC